MLINKFALAWHFYKQEYQHLHQRLLRWTQGILLIFITTLSLSSDSIQHYLEQNLQNLLGADAVISQRQKLIPAQLAMLEQQSNKVVATQQIKTTLTHKAKWQRVKLKAVGSEYPLQGNLLTSDDLTSEAQSTSGGPLLGNIWIDARLLASLSLVLGDYITIANKQFLVTRLLQHEPDRLMEGHTVAMRAMINIDDMQSLGVAEDLIDYRYLIAANSTQVSDIIQFQKKQLPAAKIYHQQGAHPLALFWQRTENVIGLASIVLFFMASIAISQLSQVHMKKDQYFSAICMSLGASSASGIQVSFFKWLISLLAILPIVSALSVGFHWLIIQWLNASFADLFWQWHTWSLIKPVAVVSLIFLVFHAPVWLSLHNTSVAKLFTGAKQGISHWVMKCSSVLVLVIVAINYSDNGLLTLMMVSAIAITIILMIVLSWVSLSLGEKLTENISGLFPFALYMMKQRLISKSTQIMGVGLCAFLLLFTLMLLKDIGNTMISYQRQHDGNVMISQATTPQLDFIAQLAEEEAFEIRQSKPYMHAKVVTINGQLLSEYADKPSESLATLGNSIRLHWNESLPENNQIVNGHWWQKSDKNWQQVSVEQEVMTDLGLNIGDKLGLFISGKSYHFEITASHAFQAGAGSITFWLQIPTSALKHINSPHYHMASIELNEQQWPLMAKLWQKFPTLRMISLKEMTQQFDSILAMVTQVISGFSLMIMILAAIVMLASINALESKEKKKNSIIMSFGFSKATCLRLNILEWLVTALITALGAVVGTYIAGLMIYQSQFSLTYQPDVIWLLTTVVVILVIVTGLGVYASRNNLNSSIRELMFEN